MYGYIHPADGIAAHRTVEHYGKQMEARTEEAKKQYTSERRHSALRFLLLLFSELSRVRREAQEFHQTTTRRRMSVVRRQTVVSRKVRGRRADGQCGRGHGRR